MNTGFLGPAVATVLTVYGIETKNASINSAVFLASLQQYLPFTVLKHSGNPGVIINNGIVATVLTVYGIETH